jgi:hypothetical protein
VPPAFTEEAEELSPMLNEDALDNNRAIGLLAA